MVISIRRVSKEMLWPIFLQSFSTGILVSALIFKILPLLDSYTLILLQRILGINNKINILTLCEVFIKVSLFVFIQFIVLSILYQGFAELICEKDLSFLDIALIISKPASISALLLICGSLWLLATPMAAIPFILASFMFTLLYNHTALCREFNINIYKGIILTTSSYLVYFTFISICIIKT
ncbi:MAG: hypothetical protein ACM3UU_01835 [Ignavibacteriales bacterium]